MTIALGAVGANRTLSYDLEDSFGVPSVTPAMKYLRAKAGAKFDFKADTFSSNELTPTRQETNLVYGVFKGSGDIPFDLSYASFDDFMEAAMGGTWTGDVLKIGSVARSFVFEDALPDIGIYEQNTGVTITGFSLGVKPNAMVEGSFTHIFQNQASGATLDATPTAANTNDVYDSFTGVMTKDGVLLATATGIDIKLDQPANTSEALFSKTIQQVSLGKVAVSGTLVIRLTAAGYAIKAKYINGESSDFSFTLGSGIALGKSYKFDMSKVFFTDVNKGTGEGELDMTLAFTAIYDETDASALMITRIP